MLTNNKPLVTVVTITFELIKSGREKFFRQCVESVHNQSYENIEHIIIDGASKDGTVKLLKEYADKGWIRYISEPDSGVYDAMNKGVELAKGKYISFLNSDDFYHTNATAELSVNALEKTRADYSFADTLGVDWTNDKPISIWRGNVNLIPFGNHYCHQSMFIKLNTLKQLGGFNLSYTVSADSELMVKLVAQGKKYVYVPHCIVSYRNGGLSNSHIIQTRKDHSDTFYNQIGKKYGLTLEECYSLWNFSLIRENNIIYILWLSRKLKKEWRKELYSRSLCRAGIRGQLKRVVPSKLRKSLSNIYYLIRVRIK